jgi:hypothetical protein
MMPTISTVAADGTHIYAPSAMFDMTDSDHTDFQGMASQVVRKLEKSAEIGEGMTRQILSGLWEDIVGAKQSHARA